VQISGEDAKILLHKWRSEESAILVGAETAVIDKPELNVRFWYGENPVKIIFDSKLRYEVQGDQPIVIFNKIKSETMGNATFVKCESENFIVECLEWMRLNTLQSVLVEGGALTLQKFLDAGLWDECRVIESREKTFEKGLKSPVLKKDVSSIQDLTDDIVKYYYKS
jgi:diaminohydroxyphosphoribosylaminopyrimidine deaminase/5-amino-6-(5-phosphoribosylamino)uracil reductase